MEGPMKGDFSRRTFDGKKHYDSVQQQQGRVQLDSDWNEQVAIAQRRVETEALDVIGHNGGPIHEAAFRVLTSLTSPPLSADEQALAGNALPSTVPAIPAGNFAVTAGRYWVDGI